MPWKECSLVEQRETLAVAMLARREPVRVICGRFGVSRPTAYKYMRRFMRNGTSGLGERRRGRRPNKSERWICWCRLIVARRRRRPTWGPRKLRWWLRQRQPRCQLPSARTIARWLSAAGLVPVRRVRRICAPVPMQPPRRGLRSNEVWTFDWKGWSRTADGRKVEPLTVRDLGSRFLLWAQPLPSRSDATIRRVCLRLFRRYGRPKAIRTDLGGPFCSLGPHGLTTLSLWWYRLGIAVEFVRRRHGPHNNAHEQMHGVLERETAQPPARSFAAQLRRLRRWQYEYNHARPHDGIGQKPPATRYRPQPTPLPKLLEPDYRTNWLVRKVSRTGDISLYSQRHYVGRTFAHLAVGCKPLHGGHHIYFDRLLLATTARRIPSKQHP